MLSIFVEQKMCRVAYSKHHEAAPKGTSSEGKPNGKGNGSDETQDKRFGLILFDQPRTLSIGNLVGDETKISPFVMCVRTKRSWERCAFAGHIIGAHADVHIMLSGRMESFLTHPVCHF